jgi:hypothetical protein
MGRGSVRPKIYGESGGPPEALVLRVHEIPEDQRSKLIDYSPSAKTPHNLDRQNVPAGAEPDPRERQFDEIARWLEGRPGGF